MGAILFRITTWHKGRTDTMEEAEYKEMETYIPELTPDELEQIDRSFYDTGFSLPFTPEIQEIISRRSAKRLMTQDQWIVERINKYLEK